MRESRACTQTCIHAVFKAPCDASMKGTCRHTVCVCVCVCVCSGEENMSVIVAPIYEGFDLRSMGTPDRVAQQFLDTVSLNAL